jgi:hypothetical protein
MPWWLALCDLGDPSWGDPWFPHSAVLLHSRQYGNVILVSLFSLFSWGDTMLSPLSIASSLNRAATEVVGQQRNRRWEGFLTCLIAFFLWLVSFPVTFAARWWSSFYLLRQAGPNCAWSNTFIPHIFVWGSCFWFCIPGSSGTPSPPPAASQT